MKASARITWLLLPLALGCAGAIAADADAPAPDDPEVRGRQVFEQRWTVAPSAFGQWGRGPLSNGEACTDCHADHGRGVVPDRPDESLRQALVKLAVPGDPPRPHPVYGAQLQHQGILGRVPAEGQAHVEWIENVVTLRDGTRVPLRAPRLSLRELAHGPTGPDTLTSMRIAPALHGVGLLDTIPDDDLLARERLPRRDGVRGRLNRIADAATGATRLGRFGHKAGQPDVRAQVLVAFLEDLGVTSSSTPREPCTVAQRECLAEPPSRGPELRDAQLDDLLAHLARLPPPPPPRTPFPRGALLFERIGCAECHTPAWRAVDATGIIRRIQPFTDLMLHDLGPGLADGVPEHAARPADWRTAPLWGVGRSRALLHDGRARNVEEAILWHDGEAAAARTRYAALPAHARKAVLRFVESR